MEKDKVTTSVIAAVACTAASMGAPTPFQCERRKVSYTLLACSELLTTVHRISYN